MIKFNQLVTAGLASAVAAAALTAPVASAEVSGSIGIASTYLWRGYDLGTGTPAVWGDLNYSNSGAYVGVWGSSGDTVYGTEYDLYAGYGFSFGADDMFSVDLSIWNYNYPTGAYEIDFADLTEVILSVGVGPVALTVYDNVANNGGASYSGYRYYTASYAIGQFAITVGMHDNPSYYGYDPVHVNLDYAYNDNLVFTLSQFVADEEGTVGGNGRNDIAGDDVKFVASYSIPIDL